MAATNAVQSALDRSLQSARERGWNFRMGDAGPEQPQQPQNPQQPGMVPFGDTQVTQDLYNRMQANPGAATAWFNAPEESRQALMQQGRQLWQDINAWDTAAGHPERILQDWYARSGGNPPPV